MSAVTHRPKEADSNPRHPPTGTTAGKSRVEREELVIQRAVIDCIAVIVALLALNPVPVVCFPPDEMRSAALLRDVFIRLMAASPGVIGLQGGLWTRSHLRSCI